MSTSTAGATPRQSIGCMEIWGGNEAFDNAISIAGLDAWIHARPYGGSERGGDIHYISSCGHGRIARFFVADVSGHGAQVGDAATKLRRLMRRNMNKLDQTRFVRALNTGFQKLATGGLFATAVLTSYYAPTHDLLICNAGHPRPLWYHAATGDWHFLDAESQGLSAPRGNLPLGIIDSTDYEQFAIQLAAGDFVVIYTDWLTEARAPSGELLGEEGLRELVSGIDVRDPALIGTQITVKADEYRASAPPDDDVTLIVLHHSGADPPPFTVGDWMRSAGKMLGLLKV